MSDDRVLQYVRVLDNGGIEKLIFNYLINSDREVLNYDFLLIRDQEESYEKELKELSCKKIVIHPKSKGFILSRYLNLYKTTYEYFKSCPYKVVHFQAAGESFGGAIPILAAKRAGIPVRICHAHSAQSKVNIVRLIDEALGRVCHRRWSTHWFACSKMAAEYSYGKKWLGKVEYVHNAIKTSDFSFDAEARNRIRQSLNVDGKFVMGNIGRLSPPKNHFFMIDILECVVKANKNVVLLLVGGLSATHEQYAESIRDYIKAKGLEDYVLMVGEQKATNDYLSAMDIFLFPSLWEGLGIVAIEAQTNGIPVIASTRVPEEARITEQMKVMDLKDGAEAWGKYILDTQWNRKNVVQEIIDAGYDIGTEAVRLQGRYIELLH